MCACTHLRRPIESHSWVRENIIAGALLSPHSVRPEREETWGGVSPHHPTRGPGDHRKLPKWEPKMDFMLILGQKEAIWNTIFSIFERRWALQTSQGPGKLSPLPPTPSRQACIYAPKAMRGFLLCLDVLICTGLLPIMLQEHAGQICQ